MKPRRIWRYQSEHGARCEFAIETAGGVFAGIVPYERLHRLSPRQIGPNHVDIWHPVPRWMSPGEVLRTIEP